MDWQKEELALLPDDTREWVTRDLHPLVEQVEDLLREHGVPGAMLIQLSSEPAPEHGENMKKVLMGRFRFHEGVDDAVNEPEPMLLAAWAVMSGLVDPNQIAAMAAASKNPADMINGLESIIGSLTPDQRANLDRLMKGGMPARQAARKVKREPVAWETIEDDDGNVVGFRNPKTGEEDLLN